MAKAKQRRRRGPTPRWETWEIDGLLKEIARDRNWLIKERARVQRELIKLAKETRRAKKLRRTSKRTSRRR